jgi:hypothetical protein
MNASYSFAQAKYLVVDDLARQKTQDRKQASLKGRGFARHD